MIDFGGTLDADGRAWKERFYACYRDEGLDLDESQFARHYYDADDPLVGGIPVDTGFDETVRQLVANLEAGLGGGDPDRSRRVADRFIADSRAALARNAAVLARLAKRYQLGIVSNFYGNLNAVCRDTGIEPHIAVAIDSTQAGEEKPNPGIFRAALDRIQVQPTDCIFVGDSLPRDRTGARNVGMPFIWVASPEARRQSGTTSDDRIVASIAELEEVLT
ncbi:MAG: HAD family hydrolase [Alphaproteobacteria bacterium]